ncbi:MAG: DUF2135 domain-containing protein [Polyangiaceae bacterium]|nr:DUF2135 domain-containing protein [Polyangiaceae bacterium]
MNRNLISRAAMRRSVTALLAGATVLVQGCTLSVSARRPPPPTLYVEAGVGGQSQGVVMAQPQVATGVTVVEVACSPGAQEVCDGLDNNCNGAIDEGCGYSSGQVQITLAWNTGADIDLYVTDPSHETINYSSPRSSSGGHLDIDARGNCTQGQSQTVENVYWDAAQPPPGLYKVEVHYWAENACSANQGPTPITLSISVGGRVIGAYNYVLNPHDRVAVATFQI